MKIKITVEIDEMKIFASVIMLSGNTRFLEMIALLITYLIF